MKNIFRIVDLIVEKIEQEYSNDIAIFAYYGSYVYGTEHSKSDLDFFFIPKTARGYELSYQFIIDDIGFDLFPISWERAEKIAAFDQPLMSIIAESIVSYSNSENDLERFNNLKSQIAEKGKLDNRTVMLDKASDYLNQTYVCVYNLESSNITLTDSRIEVSKLISNVLLSISSINQVYYHNGMGKNIEEAFNLELRPVNFKKLIDQLITEQNIKLIIKVSKELINNTKTLITNERSKLKKCVEHAELFTGYYEEIKSSFNKIINACEKHDYYTAYFTCANIQNEISLLLAKGQDGIWYEKYNTYNDYSYIYTESGLPNLLEVIDKDDLSKLKNIIKKLDNKFKELLILTGVKLNIFETLEEFENFYKS